MTFLRMSYSKADTAESAISILTKLLNDKPEWQLCVSNLALLVSLNVSPSHVTNCGLSGLALSLSPGHGLSCGDHVLLPVTNHRERWGQQWRLRPVELAAYTPTHIRVTWQGSKEGRERRKIDKGKKGWLRRRWRLFFYQVIQAKTYKSHELICNTCNYFVITSF